MPVKTKRKAVKKEAPLTPKYERLRLREWMMFWVLFAATVALVCAIFGDVDVRTLRPVGVTSSTSTDQRALVDDLKSEVVSLQNTIDEIAAKTNIEKSTGSDGCLYEEILPPDNYVKYTDVETTVSVSLPYLFSWNGRDCILAPFELDEKIIQFGPKIALGEYTVRRDSSLIIQPVKTQKNIDDEIKALQATFSEGQISNKRVRTINGLSVTSLTLSRALGGQDNYWWALGRTYSYEIHSYQWLTDAEAIKIIQSLRVTK